MEMVITVAIFSVVAVVTHGGLSRFIEVRDQILFQQARLTELSKTHTFLAKDLKYALFRLRRQDDGLKTETNFSVNEDPRLLHFASLQRHYQTELTGIATQISYQLVENTLVRTQQFALDPTNNEGANSLRLLNQVATIEVEQVQLSAESPSRPLIEPPPAAIRFLITMENGQSFDWLFDLPSTPTQLDGDASI